MKVSYRASSELLKAVICNGGGECPKTDVPSVTALVGLRLFNSFEYL